MIMAEKKALTTTPARSSPVTWYLPVMRPIPQTSHTVPRAPANAKTAMGDRPHRVQLRPPITAIIAPRPAPLETPRMYGSASGLRSSA